MLKRISIKISLTVLFVVQLTLLSGCGTEPEDDGSEGGVIGSGLILRGTVTDVRAFASNTLLIKARSGEVSRAVIDDTGQYRAPNIVGSPPFLLRADLGNNEFRYGIAFNQEIANVHSYTDVIMRNWFESGNGDIDFEFEQQKFTTNLPSQLQFKKNANVFFSYVRLVLESYQLTGDQLLSGDYDTSNNNSGIDSFLRKNPMFIENEKVALVITDPVTDNQSTTRLGFSVFELTSDADNEPPEEPKSVRALPSASNEIILIWEPALDNKGVVGYDVYRERELIATTPYPVFIDTALESDLLYTYEVIAFDASNNRSATSVPTTSGTLGEPDTMAPPAPVQLAATPKIGRMNLLWGQSNIGDVVEFDIYRGLNNSSLDFLTTVTGSIHSDVTVSSGAKYCYQVVAIDASGNESPRSMEACEMAIGDAVERLTDAPEPTVPPLAGLNVPDTQNMVCEELWSSYVIDTSEVISAGCYQVEESIEINNGGNLRLSPGVVLKFSAGTGVLVSEGGSFTSEGTKALPVVLTAEDPTPGYWNGIGFTNSNSARNKLINSVVEFAGGGREAAAVSVIAVSTALSRIEISGSVIRSCSGAGVKALDKNAKIVKLDGTVVTDCDSPVAVDIHGLDNVTRRNDFTQNRDDWIDIGKATVTSDMTLDDLGVPYVVTDMTVRVGNLRINEGAVLQFREGADFLIDGSLTAIGSEDKPVLLTGTLQEPGHWKGLLVRGKANFKHIGIYYGGLSRSDSSEASLLVDGGEVDVDNVVIVESASYAIKIASISSKLEINGMVLLSNNKKTIHLPFSQLKQLKGDIEFDNNVNSTITITNPSIASINADIDIYDLGVSYLLIDSIILTGASLTVHAGVELFLGNAVELKFNLSSKFRAIGTINSPIVFTHDSRIRGAWNGVTLLGNSSGRMEYATLEFAGNGQTSTSATVNMDCNTNVSFYLEHSTIQDSAGWGISVSGNEMCDLTVGENVVFARNGRGDISVP